MEPRYSCHLNWICYLVRCVALLVVFVLQSFIHPSVQLCYVRYAFWFSWAFHSSDERVKYYLMWMFMAVMMMMCMLCDYVCVSFPTCLKNSSFGMIRICHHSETLLIRSACIFFRHSILKSNMPKHTPLAYGSGQKIQTHSRMVCVYGCWKNDKRCGFPTMGTTAHMSTLGAANFRVIFLSAP